MNIKECPHCERNNKAEATECYFCGRYFDGRKKEAKEEPKSEVVDFLKDILG